MSTAAYLRIPSAPADVGEKSRRPTTDSCPPYGSRVAISIHACSSLEIWYFYIGHALWSLLLDVMATLPVEEGKESGGRVVEAHPLTVPPIKGVGAEISMHVYEM